MTARTFIMILAIIWASPYTLFGLFLGFIGICTGGHARIRGRVIEFYGGGVKWLLQQFFFGEGAMAFTLGHTILGQTDAALDISRDHEMVHVRQFERWGPLMGPAYLGWRESCPACPELTIESNACFLPSTQDNSPKARLQAKAGQAQ